MNSPLSNPTHLQLRPASQDDCQLLWQWSNDPVVRAYSFSSDPIPWEVHCQWLAAKLTNPDCYMYIACDQQNCPVGQIRFDGCGPGRVEVGVSIDPAKRGLGFGKQLIQLGTAHLFQRTVITEVYALIKPENQASIKAFQDAGFSNVGLVTIQNTTALKYWKVKAVTDQASISRD